MYRALLKMLRACPDMTQSRGGVIDVCCTAQFRRPRMPQYPHRRLEQRPDQCLKRRPSPLQVRPAYSLLSQQNINTTSMYTALTAQRCVCQKTHLMFGKGSRSCMSSTALHAVRLSHLFHHV